MDAYGKGLRADIARAAVSRRHDDWRECSAIYADYLDDLGQCDRAERRRRKILTRRRPGLLWPRPGSLAVSDHQREQLRVALSSPVGILAGTPGTGKTYSTAAVVGELLARYGANQVAVAAPTGKAAMRITQTMRQYNVRLRATTLHQLLEIGRNGHDGQGWGFMRNARHTLEESFVIVDESSMLDTDLAASLLSACDPSTHILLVGDPHQLPPVGHGAPLRDLMAAGVPCGRLTEIRRNAGLIVQACAAIKDGQSFETCEYLAPEHGLNLKHIEQADAHRQLADLSEVLTSLAIDVDISAGFQVIVGTNKGPLGRHTVNRWMQDRLNSDGARVEGNCFRVGDKIVCTKNSWHEDAEALVFTERYIANGEIGTVIDVEPRVTIATFEDPFRTIRIPMKKFHKQDEDNSDEEEIEDGTGCDFDLGYAITCHKAQGSEWHTVMVLIDDSSIARRVCTREWLYTAISRASRQCITIGRRDAMTMMSRRVSLDRRKTFLRELITGN